MYKIILSAVILVLTQCTTTAQGVSKPSETTVNAYVQAMETNIRQLDTASSGATLRLLANNFERIANAEKNKWEPFYYAAYCYALMAVRSDAASIDMLADKADSYLVKAVAISDNSETSALKAMILSSRIIADPINRIQTIGREAAIARETAKVQDPSNPRPYFLEARMLARMPEGMGGGSEAAKKVIEKAVQKYESFKPASSIAPQWGYQAAKQMLDGLNK